MLLSDLLSKCVCGEMSVPSAMPCHAKRKGSWRRDTMAFATYLPHFLVRFAPTLTVEPQLQPLDNWRLNLRNAVTSPEARLDMKAGGFWSRGVTAFFDVRVTHGNSKCNQGKATSKIFKEQEEEKKRKYQQRVLDVEMGSFTPLVLESTVGWEPTATAFSNAQPRSSQKRIRNLITLLSLELEHCFVLRFTCIGGPRTPFHKIPQGNLIDDCRLNELKR